MQTDPPSQASRFRRPVKEVGDYPSLNDSILSADGLFGGGKPACQDKGHLVLFSRNGGIPSYCLYGLPKNYRTFSIPTGFFDDGQHAFNGMVCNTVKDGQIIKF